MTRLPVTTYPHALMTEFPASFPRVWFEFIDSENSKRFYKCHVTWFTTDWNWIFGRGCQGIDKELSNHGCCSNGAYYFDREDEARTKAAANRLTPEMWQNYQSAQHKKFFEISEMGLDKNQKTKKINGSCLFFKDFPLDKNCFGCARHRLADKEGIHYAETKPDICWQLLPRRSWKVREVGYQLIEVVVIGEYTREAWGEGGANFDWYCSANTDAHNAKNPAYVTHKEVFTRIMNSLSYTVFKERCDQIMEVKHFRMLGNLPIFVIHPTSAYK